MERERRRERERERGVYGLDIEVVPVFKNQGESGYLSVLCKQEM